MKKKEFKLHPAVLLFILTIIVMVISSVGSILNLETIYKNASKWICHVLMKELLMKMIPGIPC